MPLVDDNKEQNYQSPVLKCSSSLLPSTQKLLQSIDDTTHQQSTIDWITGKLGNSLTKKKNHNNNSKRLSTPVLTSFRSKTL